MSDTMFEPTKEEFLANVAEKIHENDIIFHLLRFALEHIESAIKYGGVSRSVSEMKDGKSYAITVDSTEDIEQVILDAVCGKKDKETVSEADHMRQAVLEDKGF